MLVGCMLLGSIALAGPAGAHGEIESSDPAPESRVRRAPGSVAITFTEAPTAQAVLEVTDGCRRKVGQGVDVADATATVRTATGQPGRWQVSYRVISAADGHETKGKYAFTVAGKKDCTPDPKPTDEPKGDEDPAAPNDKASPDDSDDTGGSSAPVVPIALGAAALIVVALLVRRSGSG
jgi:methionine-rich copper-binding protein CopC